MNSQLRIGYVGQPGERAFHVQILRPVGPTAHLCEKQQVAGIALLLENLLDRIDRGPINVAPAHTFALVEPVDTQWRVGTIVVGIDDDLEGFTIRIEEVTEDESDPKRYEQAALSIEQAQMLATHCRQIVDEGRPPTEMGQVIKDAAGQVVFPSTNGHGIVRQIAELDEAPPSP